MPDGHLHHSADLAAMLDTQRAAFRAAGIPDLAHRRAALKRLRAAVVRNRRQIEAAARSDYGQRAPVETALVDIAPVVRAIGHMRGNLRRWMAPKSRHVPLPLLPGNARIVYQPLGVVGILSAWNYPVSLALIPLATALAAGNRAMVKPSELAPATAEVLREILETAFDPAEVAVVTGGAEVGAAFAALPFDHLFFTGSTAVGHKVALAAAENLTPVTLELGGKSPVILAPDADIELAARDLAWGKLTNAGQTCIAPDYVLAHPGQVAPLAEAMAEAVRAAHPAGLADSGLTTILNDRHHARLRGLLEDARAKGAEIVPLLLADAAAHPRAMPPTLVLGATPEMAVMQEEIFGPLLPVLTCETPEAAAEFVCDRPHPLALYLYGKDRRVLDMLLARTQSGNVALNGVMLHYAVDSLPFGGVGASGMGSYHGIEGFRRLSHARGIYRQGRRGPIRLLRPPHGWLARSVLRFILR